GARAERRYPASGDRRFDGHAPSGLLSRGPDGGRSVLRPIEGRRPHVLEGDSSEQPTGERDCGGQHSGSENRAWKKWASACDVEWVEQRGTEGPGRKGSDAVQPVE